MKVVAYQKNSFFYKGITKELSFSHKLWFSNFNIVATMNTVRLKNVSLKYQRFTLSGCKDVGITKVEFVAMTQFLYIKSNIV